MSDPIVVLGDVLLDVVVRITRPISWGSDTPARTSFAGGGSAANVAAWLGWLKTPVTFVGRIGDDLAGRARRRELLSDGVDTRLEVDPDRPTGICVVLVDRSGERTMFPDPGASDTAFRELPAAALKSARHLHVAAYSLLRSGSRSSVQAAIEIARTAGATVSIDASSYGLLRDADPPSLRQWLGLADFLFLNVDESVVIGGRQDDFTPATLLEVAPAIVLKHGAGGAQWLERQGPAASVPAPEVSVVDTTGAGDAFCAGFLDAYLRGLGPRASLAAGAKVGGLAVTQAGARPPGAHAYG